MSRISSRGMSRPGSSWPTVSRSRRGGSSGRSGCSDAIHLETGEALWITPCHGVHTWFMRFAIDVIAMDANGVVVDAVSTLKPWRMRLPRPGAYSVLELPAGTLRLRPSIGHRIQIQRWNSDVMPALRGVESAAKSA